MALRLCISRASCEVAGSVAVLAVGWTAVLVVGRAASSSAGQAARLSVGSAVEASESKSAAAAGVWLAEVLVFHWCRAVPSALTVGGHVVLLLAVSFTKSF